jgi:hypothetical protein
MTLTPQTKPILPDVDKQMLIKFLLGGAAIGGSAAVGTSLLNHLGQMSQEGLRKKQLDDDTITVYLNRKKDKEKTNSKYASEMEKEAFMTGGAGVATGVLSTLGSYALVRQMYQEMKKRRMQKMLDEAQVGFADTSMEEADAALKQANQGGRPFGPGDLLTSSPVAAALLTMIGTGALSNSYLNKTFPAVRSAKPSKPRRIVVKYKDEEQEEEKTASFSENDGFENMVRLVLAGMHDKSASDLANIVYACAEGRADEVVDSTEFGIEPALDLIKGASTNEITSEALTAGIALAVRHPGLEHTVKTLACSEWNELSPSSIKLASSLTKDASSTLEAMMCMLGAASRGTAADGASMTEKQASQLVDDNPELLQQLLAQLAPESELDANDSVGVDSGNAVQGSTEELHPVHEQVANSIGEESADDDIIDEIMAGSPA